LISGASASVEEVGHRQPVDALGDPALQLGNLLFSAPPPTGPVNCASTFNSLAAASTPRRIGNATDSAGS